MSEQSKGLVREKETARPRGRRSSSDRDDRELRLDDDWDRDESDEDDDDSSSRRHRRGRGGRPPLRDEIGDLNRGGAFLGAEGVAVALDVFSRVLRGIVDRAFDEDYNEPGDVARGLVNEADLAVYDLVDEARRAPRRLDRRFQDGIRSPRANRGERAKRGKEYTKPG